MFSVLILTLNEEKSLPGCLASIKDCDDVVVLDSGSTDRTASVATTAGARVVVHPFENFAQQRNFAHDAIEFRHPWVFHLDADEQLTEALCAECAELPATGSLDGCYVARACFGKAAGSALHGLSRLAGAFCEIAWIYVCAGRPRAARGAGDADGPVARKLSAQPVR